MFENKDIQFFYGGYENEKKKGQKNLTFPAGDLNPGFSKKFGCISAT